jgi:hypothetical protein
VTVLDESLKKLNIGLSVWVDDADCASEPWCYDKNQIGYCKVNGEWGFALRRVWGDDQRDDYYSEGPWLFNDAPREMRLRLVDKIPDVIEALDKEASETAKRVQEKTKDVRELAEAIEKITNKPRTLSERIAAGEQSLTNGRTGTLRDLIGDSRERSK